MKSTIDDTVIAELTRLFREDPAYHAMLEKMRRAQERDAQDLEALMHEALERTKDPAYLNQIVKLVRLLQEKS